jgi:hypothetical protein
MGRSELHPIGRDLPISLAWLTTTVVACASLVPIYLQLKEPLGITNKHVGYIYLVDQHAKIRWAGCGFATPEEREALRRGVAVLLGRAKEGR